MGFYCELSAAADCATASNRDTPPAPACADYFFSGMSMPASATHSHLPLRSIRVSTQP